MIPIAIYGAGGMGREILLLIQQINRVAATWEIKGFFDDGVSTGALVNGFPVLGNLAVLNQWPGTLAVVLAVGWPTGKQAIVRQINNRAVWFPRLIHPSVDLMTENFVTLGAGSILSAGTRLTVNTVIGHHVFVNLNCTIGHDVVIGDFSALMPGVHISGDVTLGMGVYVGTGATLLNRVSVGEGTIIGAGAVAINALPARCTAVGIPARPIRFHQSTDDRH